MSDLQEQFDQVRAAAEDLRTTLQGLHTTHVLYTALLLELDILEHDLAEIKEKLKK